MAAKDAPWNDVIQYKRPCDDRLPAQITAPPEFLSNSWLSVKAQCRSQQLMNIQQRVLQDEMNQFCKKQPDCVVINDMGTFWPKRPINQEQIKLQSLLEGLYNTYDPYGPMGGNYRLLLNSVSNGKITIPASGCGRKSITIDLDRARPKVCMNVTPPPEPITWATPEVPRGKLCGGGGQGRMWGSSK